jgi:hemin uptake protein HemP
MNTSSEKPSAGDADEAGSRCESRIFDWETLAAGSKEVVIEHHGQKYRLRTTRKGGLILNK